ALDLEHARAGEAHAEAGQAPDERGENVLREPPGTLEVIGHRSDVDIPGAERAGELAMRRPRADQDRARRIEPVRSRERERQPGQRRPAPADRRSGGVWTERALHAA